MRIEIEPRFAVHFPQFCEQRIIVQRVDARPAVIGRFGPASVVLRLVVGRRGFIGHGFPALQQLTDDPSPTQTPVRAAGAPATRSGLESSIEFAGGLFCYLLPLICSCVPCSGSFRARRPLSACSSPRRPRRGNTRPWDAFSPAVKGEHHDRHRQTDRRAGPPTPRPAVQAPAPKP